MARTKRKVAKKGAKEAAEAARPYVQRLVEDDDLRDNLREAYESARDAYNRAVDGKGAKALIDDSRIHDNLTSAAQSLRSASEALRDAEKHPSPDSGGGFGKVVVFAVVGAILALVLSEDLRKTVLDQLFGAEEDFEYTSTTAPSQTVPSPVAPPGA